MAWRDEYRSKAMSARDALRRVRSGDRVYIHPGCAEPEVLVEALIERAPQLREVEIVHLLTLGRADYIALNNSLIRLVKALAEIGAEKRDGGETIDLRRYLELKAEKAAGVKEDGWLPGQDSNLQPFG